MKILLISTLKRRVAKDEFASRSRVIYQLGEGLVKRGHDVSLLGTGDSSIPGVTTIPVIEASWQTPPVVENQGVWEHSTLIRQTRHMLDMQKDFDVIHSHTYPDFYPHVVDRELTVPLVSTLHVVVDHYMDDTLSQFTNSYFVALSKKYESLLTKTKIFRVVHNGIDTSLYSLMPNDSVKREYLLWLGRINGAKNKEGGYLDPKGVRHAIALAKLSGEKLLLGGVVQDKKAFDADVAPHLNDQIQWVGDVSAEQSLSTEKVISLMQNAKAFLMTVNQEEPFGLVTAEAMSCGTPVIGFDRGAFKEIVVDGETGFVVDPSEGVEGLQKALQKVGSIDPMVCRRRVEEHFAIDKMVENYEKVYEDLIADFSSKLSS